MCKLKNKHTGEVITTPYMAEVEEYLNSGDYEMSDNKYPYIGQIYSAIVLYYRKNGGVLLDDALGLRIVTGKQLRYISVQYTDIYYRS